MDTIVAHGRTAEPDRRSPSRRACLRSPSGTVRPETLMGGLVHCARAARASPAWTLRSSTCRVSPSCTSDYAEPRLAWRRERVRLSNCYGAAEAIESRSEPPALRRVEWCRPVVPARDPEELAPVEGRVACNRLDHDLVGQRIDDLKERVEREIERDELGAGGHVHHQGQCVECAPEQVHIRRALARCAHICDAERY